LEERRRRGHVRKKNSVRAYALNVLAVGESWSARVRGVTDEEEEEEDEKREER
jgi:hypothetical protein